VKAILLCLIGEPQRLEAAPVVDQVDIHLLDEGDIVHLQLEA
jgi:hypothetical protein